MAQAKLIINGEREIAVDRGAVSIGRAPDNAVSLAGDSNVSRYHIEIERRGDDFYLIELGSSNGTTVNGERVYEEILLRGGDRIVLGDSAAIDFALEESIAESPVTASASDPAVSGSPPIADAPADAPPPPIAAEAPKSSHLSLMLMIAGAVCGLAIVFAVAAVVVYSVGGVGSGKCEARATFISPESGETINRETEVEIDVGDAECVQKAIFLLNGEDFATVDAPPFKATLDPSKFAGLSDGGTYSIRVLLEDAEGNRIPQTEEVLLAFETLATPTPEPTETPADKPTPKPPVGKQISPIEAQEMSRRFVGQFSGSATYKFDPQFLQEVQKKTGEYATEGYFARASVYRDIINVAFVQEMSLDPALGYVLAMSRSGFKLPNQGSEEGLWRMSNDLATANGYNGMCGGETLSDPKQACAARAAALYLKALAINVFEGDVVYAVAAFGMSPQEASIWKSSLPADRSDFWKLIKNPKQREEVVRFFAAGAAAENPQRFGLKKDRPLSELYRNLVNK